MNTIPTTSKKEKKLKYNNFYNIFPIACIAVVLLFSINNTFAQDSTRKKKADTSLTSTGKKSGDTLQKNTLQIDTGKIINQIDTAKKEPQKIDSMLTAPLKENSLTNTKLFIYILLSALGLGLFFFIFVQTLFKTFHKKRSTRQSMMLSWSLFLIVSIIWIFIIWGIVANFWNSAAFMVVLIFLFIIGLIMTIIALKSR
ncbi:MAG: hypothetical protein HY959_09775 [Ignavibacteriae bacterium]|nr:hypothetical protein [Ignavibacteriota bacterium]